MIREKVCHFPISFLDIWVGSVENPMAASQTASMMSDEIDQRSVTLIALNLDIAQPEIADAAFLEYVTKQ